MAVPKTHPANVQKINDILIQACDGAADTAIKKLWYYWLVTESYEEVQKLTKNPDRFDCLATEAPVKENTLLHLGKDLKTLAKDLWDASDDAWLNRVYFPVMDKQTKEDGSLLLCHVEDDGTVDSLRAWTRHSLLYLRGMEAGSGTWDELKHSWEFHKEQDDEDVID
ncbi:MAG: hypothetical protein FRX48_08919 [Lasallia pustulata]|uniref:Uncharacterized protein n=1 Tax=Lasallia pustulata TaxID=136370 RepID=A0A5M8PDK1_9LECA|nr:MAG: hypothetical protein FRX48_08919 [Lasallia pustulata]